MRLLREFVELAPWGRQRRHASSRAAAAYGGGGLSAARRRRSTACSAPRPSSPARRSASLADDPVPTPPAGTAAAGPARRSRSRCSATPAPPATASTGSRRPRARCSPAAWPSRPTAASTCATFCVVGARSSDLAAQVDRALPIEPDVAVILIGANDVTHVTLPAAVGAPPLRGRTPAARRRRRGAGRHLPRPRHDQADRAAAEAGRARLVAPARGRPDDRGRRGGRPHGLARLDPRPGVRRGPGAAVRARPVPPLGRGLPLAGAAAAALGARRPRPRPRRRGRSPRPTAARACCRSPSAAVAAPSTSPAPSSTAPRSAAAGAASAASGSSCGTAAAVRRPTAAGARAPRPTGAVEHGQPDHDAGPPDELRRADVRLVRGSVLAEDRQEAQQVGVDPDQADGHRERRAPRLPLGDAGWRCPSRRSRSRGSA